MASSAGLRSKRTDAEPVSQPGTNPSTDHLVVCGVTDVRSSWLFGDFLGFTTALREQAIYGTFLNCFDLDQYFATTPFDDIKFGRRWEIPDGEIAIYKRWDFEQRTRWWTQLGQHEAPNAVTKVMEWVAHCTLMYRLILLSNAVTQTAFYERSKRLGGEKLTSTHRQRKMRQVALNRGLSLADSEIRLLVRHL